MARFVLDTHALLWFLADDSKLGKAVEVALSDPESELILPAIALAEALWIVATRKLGLTSAELLTAIDGDPRVSVYPLTREIVELASTLSTVSEMHDRQIVATTLWLSAESERFILLTKDANITDSALVPVAW